VTTGNDLPSVRIGTLLQASRVPRDVLWNSLLAVLKRMDEGEDNGMTMEKGTREGTLSSVAAGPNSS
jgi:hypothetical protein